MVLVSWWGVATIACCPCRASQSVGSVCWQAVKLLLVYFKLWKICANARQPADITQWYLTRPNTKEQPFLPPSQSPYPYSSASDANAKEEKGKIPAQPATQERRCQLDLGRIGGRTKWDIGWWGCRMDLEGFGWQANAKTWGKTLLQFAVKIASHALYFQIMRKVFRLCFPAEEHEWADELGRDCRGITIHPFQVNCSKPNQAKPNRSEPNRRELNWTELPSRTRIRIRIRQKQQQLQYTFVSLPLLCCRLFLPQCSRLSRSTGWLHAGCVKCNFSYLHNCRQQIAQNKVEIFAAVAATTKRQQQQQL